MDRIQQRSLIGSAAAHAGVLALVLVVGGLAARKAIQPDVPFLELIPTDLRLTMGDQIGGGTPNPRPLAAKEGTPPPAPVTTPAPAQAPPVPKTEEKAIAPPQPVSLPPKMEATKPVEPPKAERKIEVSKDVRPTVKAQDVEMTKKADKPTLTSPPKIQVSTQTRTLSSVDKQNVEREAQEAREAAAEEAQARARRASATQKLASRLSGAAAGVSKNVGGSTQTEMPGPGGAAYAPYTSWLQTFLYEQWRRPTSSSQNQEWVGLEIVIARDGTVLSVEIKRSSGIRSLDASAEEIFRRHRKLRPLPDEFKESRLVVPIKFVLEAPGSV